MICLNTQKQTLEYQNCSFILKYLLSSKPRDIHAEPNLVLTDTTKRMKVRDVVLFVLPQFIWSLIQNWPYRNSVLNITRCVYSFCPKVLCHVSLLNHGASHLLQCPILPLYNSILLWSSRAGEIMGDAI